MEVSKKGMLLLLIQDAAETSYLQWGMTIQAHKVQCCTSKSSLYRPPPPRRQPADGAARVLLEMTDTLMKVLVNLSSAGAGCRPAASRASGGRPPGGGALLGAQPGLLDALLHAVLRLPEQLPEQIAASPFDRNQALWQEDPILAQKTSVPYVSSSVPAFYDRTDGWGNADVIQLWPYASTYQVVPAAWLR